MRLPFTTHDMPSTLSFLIIASSAAVFALAGFYFYRLLAAMPQGWDDSQVASISLRGHMVHAQVAASQSKQSQGLSGRVSLEKNEGMLFVFSKPQRLSFWMKGMLIPLDFIWINGDTIVDLTENVVPPTSPLNLNIISPATPADKVLEINAGLIQAYGITKGDRIAILH